MYSADDMILIQQLNDMASGRTGLPEMRSTSSVADLLASKPFPMVLPQNRGFSAGRPDLTGMPDGPTPIIQTTGRRAAEGAGGAYADLSGMFYDGLGPKAKGAQRGINKTITKVAGRGGRRMAGKAGAAIGALPGMGALGNAAKVLGPAAAGIGGALAVGDVVFGQDSGANKAMDATAMTIGGILGSVGGPLGTAAGVGLGKMASDATQFVFGGGKSAEERRMEEALAMLQGGRG